MSSRRLFLTCTCASVLLHLLVLWLAYRFPSTVRRPEEVMEIDLSDIPRATDFLPPEPGLLEGRPPPVRPAPATPREARTELPVPGIMEGRVPDLPVRPDLPPEKSFPPSRPREEPPPEATGPSAPAGKETGGSAAKPEPAPPAPRGKNATAPPAPSKSVRDLIPPLGTMVLAAKEPSGGRGQGASGGDTVGTGGAATGKEGIVEEGGPGVGLTALNAPQVQFISYFASIKRKIENVWNYPYEAATAGIQGELTIVFVIVRSGKVDSIDLIRGSGSKILDDEAIRAIRKAAPFDPIPPNYPIKQLEISGRFVYVHGGALRLR